MEGLSNDYLQKKKGKYFVLFDDQQADYGLNIVVIYAFLT